MRSLSYLNEVVSAAWIESAFTLRTLFSVELVANPTWVTTKTSSSHRLLTLLGNKPPGAYRTKNEIEAKNIGKQNRFDSQTNEFMCVQNSPWK
jgi:hypothetical protein